MKKFIAASLAFLFVTGGILPSERGGASDAQGYTGGLPITAPSALLIDGATGKIIYAKNPHARRPPASTTKIMTALVVLEKSSLEDIVRIPKWVNSIEPSKVYLRPGEQYRIRDLVHATLISSANDASEVLAVATAGSQAQFAEWMNERARRIGCHNTNFVNASGLPAKWQYSSSYDLAMIMKEARRSPFIVESLSTKYIKIRSLAGRQIFLKNHNRFLWKTQRAVIGKTGWTRRGRHCFVGRINGMGREILVSMLGSHRLWVDLKILLDYQSGVALYKIKKNKKKWSATETQGIQNALKRAGYNPGKADGKFGPKTMRAVELFQKERGLYTTGFVDLSTCNKLTRYGLSKSTCR